MNLNKKRDIRLKIISFCAILTLHCAFFYPKDQNVVDVPNLRSAKNQGIKVLFRPSTKIMLRQPPQQTKNSPKLGHTKSLNLNKIKQKIEQIDFWSPKSNLGAFSSNMAPQNLEDMSSSFQFIVPRKLEKDQKTKLESELLAFSKRVYLRFISQVHETISDKKRANPRMRLPASRAKDQVIIQVTYDQNGNLQRMQTLEPAREDLYNHLFETALGNIEVIPNPPKLLLDRRKQYRVNYALKINFL